MAEPNLSDELKKMESERLLDIEKNVTAWSLILGIFLLAILV